MTKDDTITVILALLTQKYHADPNVAVGIMLGVIRGMLETFVNTADRQKWLEWVQEKVNA